MFTRKGYIICLAVYFVTNSSISNGKSNNIDELMLHECENFNNRRIYNKPIEREVSVKMDAKSINIRKILFGFNTSYTVSKQLLGKYPISDIKQYKGQYKLNALRFPGGTVGNYFDWRSMSLNREWDGYDTKISIKKLYGWHKKLTNGDLLIFYAIRTIS